MLTRDHVRIGSVLCPVDFSEASRTALRTAVRVVRQFNARLHVLFVEDPLLAAASASASVSPALEEELKQFVVSTSDLDLAADPMLYVATGDPAGEIVRFAEREHINVIVMGTHGRTGVRKAFFGSTTARVLRRTMTPLLMVPAPDGVDRGRNLAGLGSILVLIDFGSSAAGAASAAASLAEMVGARLVLVHVVPPVSAPLSWASRARAAMDYRTADAHQRMGGAMAPLEKYGPVESVIVEGNIAESIAELARARHGGLIVMGLDREPGGPRPGSTAYAVLCSTPVPVLAIPAAASDVPGRVTADRQEATAAQ